MKSKYFKFGFTLILLAAILFVFSGKRNFNLSNLLSLSFNTQTQKQNFKLLDEAAFSPTSKNESISDPTSLAKPQSHSSNNEFSLYLQMLIKDGDFCRALEKTYDEKPHLSEAVKLYFSIPNNILQDQESDRTAEYILTNIVNPESVNPEAPVDTNNIIEFYRALVYGQLIDPKEGYESFVDFKKAELILSGLELKDPNNGAYPLFRAAAQLNEGASEESVRPLIEKAMQAKIFDDYHTYIWRRVLQRSFQTSVSFMLSQVIARNARIISFTKIMETVKNIVKAENADYARLTEMFATKLRPALLPDGGRFEFYEWDILEYGWSEVLHYNAEKVLHPHDEIPYAKRPTELLTFRDEPEYKDTFEAEPGIQKKCDSIKLQNYVKHEEKIYTDYFSKMARDNN